MNRVIAIIILIQSSLLAITASNSAEQAMQAYNNEDYTSAIEIYENIAQTEGVSSQLYYNLGNSYYKDYNIPRAILNYERAKLLAPNDKDITANLELANSRIVDKIDSELTSLLSKWVSQFRDINSANQWAYIAIIAFIIAIIGIALYIFSKSMAIKKIGFFSAIVLIIVCFVSNIFAYQQSIKIEERTTAIITTPSVVVRSSPAESGTELFLIHEGTKVSISDKVGNWDKIELSDGKVGWMESSKLEII